MSNNFPLQRRIRLEQSLISLDERTTTLNNEVGFIDTVLNGNTAGFTTDYVDTLGTTRADLEARKAKIAVKRAKYVNFLSIVEADIGSDSTALTSGQQTTVTDISTKFDSKYGSVFENLQFYPDSEKDRFFNLYGEATDDNLREIVIKSFFNL